ELRLFARRHAFAGFTRVAPSYLRSGSRLVATRHHAVDWNYVGRARPRPNKGRGEMGPGGDTWREWGFAKVG
ncbi:unnamed protein product, partial [Scytosiphon promiscuus]